MTPKHHANAGSPGSNINSRPSASASASTSTSTSTSAHNAALTGAARAFINGLPPQDLVRYVNGHSPQSALRPTAAGIRRKSSDYSTKSQQARADAVVNKRVATPNSGGGLLVVPQHRPQPAKRSPSSIAASVAAARASPSPAPSAISASGPRSQAARSPAPSSRARTGSNATTNSAERLDETSIPPTTSLVKLFEQNDKLSAQNDSSAGPPPTSSKPATIQSPKPVRRSQILEAGLTPLFPPGAERHAHDRQDANRLLKDALSIHAPEESDDSASIDSFRSAKEMVSPARTSKPPLPLPRRKNRQDGTGPVAHDPVRPGINLQPPSRDVSGSAPVDIRRPSSSRASSSHGLRHPHPSITAAFNQMHPRHITPLTTGDSLANAIVASSLASSRAHSPHKLQPQSSGRQKAASISHSLFSRTPSPPKKGMRHTMRTHSSSSSEDDEVPFAKHKKKTKKFLRKHPNKHHEGDRKRWRDAITERERKRYEGVWAANKGVNVFFTPEEQAYLDRYPRGIHADKIRNATAEQVTDAVTRDIWSRSRLPEDTLEQVWDLVDSQANGRLLKEEFVVGLWLIDQCLKGRKLPIKVTESVWSSVRFLHGIKVRKR